MRCAPVEVEDSFWFAPVSQQERAVHFQPSVSLSRWPFGERGAAKEREREQDGKADWTHSFRVRHIDVAFARLRVRNAT